MYPGDDEESSDIPGHRLRPGLYEYEGPDGVLEVVHQEDHKPPNWYVHYPDPHDPSHANPKAHGVFPSLTRARGDVQETERHARVANDYRLQHRAPGPHWGYPLHDMDVGEDWYEHPEWYGGDHSDVSQSEMRQAQQAYIQARGNPDHPITIYRALPPGHTTFHAGDWVTPTLGYARGHAIQSEDPADDWPVIKATVPAKHLWQNGDSYHELGYHGPDIRTASLHEAMPRADDYQGIPEGYDFKHSPGVSTLTPKGSNSWASRLLWHPNGEVKKIDTEEDHQRKGLATHLFNETLKHYPNLHHSEDLTDEGRAWTNSMYDWNPDNPDDDLPDIFAADDEGSYSGPSDEDIAAAQEWSRQENQRKEQYWLDAFNRTRREQGIPELDALPDSLRSDLGLHTSSRRTASFSPANISLYPRTMDAEQMAIPGGLPPEEIRLELVNLGDSNAGDLPNALAQLADVTSVLSAYVYGAADLGRTGARDTRYLYHHTSPEHRDSIMQHGLLADRDETADLDDPDVTGGSFLTTDPNPRDNSDVWRVDTHRLPRPPEEDYTGFPEHDDENWFWVPGGVPPHALNLHSGPDLGRTGSRREAMPTLYRGLEGEFDPDYDASQSEPSGYTHWTDNPELARQYAGPKGSVYQYDLPDEAMGQSYINDDGERPLYYDNDGRAALNGVSGKEYLVYQDHEDYDPSKIRRHSSASYIVNNDPDYSGSSTSQHDFNEISYVQHQAYSLASQLAGIPYQTQPWVPALLVSRYATADDLHFTGEIIFDRIGLTSGGHTQFFPLAGSGW
jgi:hypothetical protein